MIAAVLAAAVALAAPSPAPAAPAAASPVRAPVVRANAEQWDMTTKITGRSYRIYVAKPTAKGPPPPGGYPVVYVTDGDLTFLIAADTQMMLSQVKETRPAIIVGVGYGKGVDAAVRTRFADLTPFPPDAATAAALEANPSFKGLVYGEAEGFYRFLTEELRPQIEADYKTDRSDNILWGHSFGGLFGLHVLFNHPDAFGTYLIGSPSIIWGDHAILKEEARLTAPLAAGKAAPRILFTVGEYEEKLADDARLPAGVSREQMQAMQKAVGMQTNVLALADRLKALKAPPGYEVKTVIFDGETHVSVMPAVISRGLRFALKP
jgi:predicted alpha/beta superfamily hydrolase